MNIPDPPRPETLNVMPKVAVISVGEVLYLGRIVTDQYGDPLDCSVEWRSLGSSAATVDDGGRVTGVASGQATVVASVGHLEASAEVTVK